MLKKNIQKHFSKAANTYSEYALAQKKMSQALLTLLPAYFKPIKSHSILDIGCADGLVTRELFNIFPNSKILGIDLSTTMIKQADLLFDKNHPISFMQSDGEKLSHLDQFDLIFSSSTFQWFENLADFLNRVQNHMRLNGIIAFSLLLEENFDELHKAMKIIKPNYTTGPTLYSYKQVINLIESSHLTLMSSENTIFYHNYDSLNDFFIHQKKTGATNPFANNQADTFNRNDFKKLDQILMDNKENKQLKVKYHFGIFICKKPII